MGAGCYYTLPQNRDILAYWIELPESDDQDSDDSWIFDCMVENIGETLLTLPLCDVVDQFSFWYGKHYKIELVSTHYGDGLQILLSVDLPEYHEKFNFFASNLSKVYAKIIKHVNKDFDLKRAAGSWCSTTIEKGSL